MNDNAKPDEGMNRRQFLALTTTVVTAGCSAVSPSQAPRLVDAGPATGFAAEGVYNNFRDQGFFLIRKDGKLFALSSYCTHRKCKLDAEPDHSFYCHCHGSTFDPAGSVTEGPATRNLPVLAMNTDARGHLVVTVPAA
jgi:nitrite reductase/ring-hydroxylating ferredoxin subunit